MCGIAGEIDFSGKERTKDEVFLAMKNSLRPRGPDQEGLYEKGKATLIHSRLAVVDLEGGMQPLTKHYQGEEYTLVYNGELYNTENIRCDLLACGHSFLGYGDTEVLLTAFIQWGEGCLARLNGIFAFAVWKGKEEKLFLARDRMGVKPLFYTLVEEKLIFASEIKALLCHPEIPPKVSRHSLAEMLLLGPGRPMGKTVFPQIQELKAAECAWYCGNTFTPKSYWNLVDRPYSFQFQDTLMELRALVVDAIERQVSCDVPVCTFLSGGLDSSLITAVAAQTLKKEGKQLHSFSVDYLDNDKNFTASKFQPSRDDYYINLVSQAYETQHHTVLLDTPQLVHALTAAVEARDLPGMADVDSSLLLFCQEVKQHATVALSGECADELFGGYPWYRDPEIRERAGFPWAQNTAYRLSFLQDDFASALDGEALLENYYQETLFATHKFVGGDPQEGRMKEMTRLNTDWFMQTLLERKDRMSMACGLEVRVPFCDFRIAELLYTMPWDLKEYQGAEKGILRQAMEGYLPEEVLWRKKSPYPKTYNPNYRQAVGGILGEIIRDYKSPLLEFVSKEALERLLTEENSVPWYGQLMTTPQTIAYFIQVNHWLKKYKIEIT
ncbi:MAG: asparagine synthase (glutamine-hydrolyzing) [Eubacteriales bacterium]